MKTLKLGLAICVSVVFAFQSALAEWCPYCNGPCDNCSFCACQGYGTGTCPTGGGGGGGNQAIQSSRTTVSRVIRQSVVQQAAPEAPEQTRKLGRLNSGSADVFYNKWEVGGLDGSTFGINPSATWGETGELTLTAPLHIVSPDSGDTIFAIGLDGAYKRPLTDKFAVGIHAYGMGFFGGDDTATTFGGGPFLSYNYRINPKWIVSVGGLLEFTKPDEGDTVTEIVPGVNVGYNLSNNVALNGYLIHYKNLDSDAGDDAYTDIGADVQWVKGSWSLSVGIKTATGLDNVSSTEIYLGSNWMF